MIRLNIYLVYSEELENRRTTINSSVSLVKDICQQKNIEMKLHVITEPSKVYINTNISAFNSRVNYDKFADTASIYNDLIMPLNACQISNFEKHRYIYKLIAGTKASVDDKVKDIHMIMEDDIIILKDHIENISALIDDLNAGGEDDDWDILFNCLNVVNNPEKFIDINEATIHLLNQTAMSHYDIETLSYYFTRAFEDKIIEVDWKVSGWDGTSGRFMYY